MGQARLSRAAWISFAAAAAADNNRAEIEQLHIVNLAGYFKLTSRLQLSCESTLPLLNHNLLHRFTWI